jgi:hypothetical protein
VRLAQNIPELHGADSHSLQVAAKDGGQEFLQRAFNPPLQFDRTTYPHQEHEGLPGKHTSGAWWLEYGEHTQTMSDFRLLMISAMYENGGNVTHRFLDGIRRCWCTRSSRSWARRSSTIR